MGTITQNSTNSDQVLKTGSSPTFVDLTSKIKGMTVTATTGTFTLSNGKTLAITNSLTFSGTDASTLNIGTGGTLGTAAYTTAATYEAVANKSTDGTLAANSDTLYPSQKAVKTYADGLVVGLLDDRGSFDASGNVFPSSGGSGSAGAVLKGDLWYISVTGTLGGVLAAVGSSVRALTDAPGQTAGNWDILNVGLGYTPENSANKNASGGYVGLSGFSIQFKNAANTFTSLFSNANTASRTYTFPDVTGTVAMTSDLPATVVYTARTADRTQAVNEGTIANKAGTACNVTVPTTAAVGTVQAVVGKGATGWTITLANGQIIHDGDVDSISTGGVMLASSNRYDCVELMCVVADTEWVVRTSQGNLTITNS